jgi:hypothetical protein
MKIAMKAASVKFMSCLWVGQGDDDVDKNE